MLEAFAERVPGLDVAALLAGPVQRCNPAAWGAAERAAKASHVTADKDPALRARLRAALMADPDIGRRLCRLARALGYAEPECPEQPPEDDAAG